MKKVSVTAVKKGNTLYNLVANHKGNLINLTSEGNKRQYKSLQDMYKAILDTLKANNLWCGSFMVFGTKWYDIQFVDVENYIVTKYAYEGD